MEDSKLGRNKKFTQEEIIQIFRKVHGNKYNYSKVNYRGMNIPITIICPVHGEFEQRPVNHKSGRGCPKCGVLKRANKRRIDLSDLIKSFREVHGDKYNYDKVVYKDSLTKIKIICPEHGAFEQTPASHKSGFGCPECGNAKRKSTEEFIEECNKVHNKFYDYSKVVYINTKSPVTIICPIHGEFEQIAQVHKNGSICPKCLGRSRTTKDWICEFNTKHENKYNYNKFTFINSKEKAIIICPEHGEFLQTPSDHLHGYGCPKCAGTQKLTREEFIESCIAVHGNKYDYRLVDYINNTTKVKIICKDHGVFKQLPMDHKKGIGCPKCKESRGEKRISEYLDRINIKYESQKKFKDCKYKNRLPFDFYISEKNLLIEYHGEQHYEEIPFFHETKQRLEDARKRDKIKEYYAEKNQYKLLVISYTDFDNIETILENEILST